LERLLEPLRTGRADATVGTYSRDVEGLNFADSYKQLYIARIYDRRLGYLKNFWTAIGAIDATIFHASGGFDTGFIGANGEDAEFGCRLSEKGFRIVPVFDALGQHRHSATLRGILVNDWRKGIGAMRHYYRSSGPLSDNCHATQRDKAAVLLAVLTFCLPTLMLLADQSSAQSVRLAAVCAAVYLAVRSDIVAGFLSQGAWFVIRAVVVMTLLDLIRCACVATGLCIHVRQQARGQRVARMWNDTKIVGDRLT
jgi:hypothetical protein